jgi:hypothetical protein
MSLLSCRVGAGLLVSQDHIVREGKGGSMALGAYATTPRKGPWPVHQTVCVGRAEVGFRSVSYEAVGYR